MDDRAPDAGAAYPAMVRRVLAALLAGLLAFAATGCGPAEPAPDQAAGSPVPGTSGAPSASSGPSAGPSTPAVSPTTPSSTSAAPAQPVTVSRTGGYAGVEQKIAIDRVGGWRYTSGGGAAQTGRLSAGHRDQLRGLLADPGLRTVPTESGTCSDGFHYLLVSGTLRTEWDDCGTTGPAQQLIELLAEATPF